MQDFLYPTAAVNDYLCAWSSHPAEQSAHQTAEGLRQRGNSRYQYRHPSGVVLGTCSTCDESIRAPVKKRADTSTICVSVRHVSGQARAARYIPSPSIVHLLWPSEEVEAERSTPRGKRRKVCSGCRSSAERQSRSGRLVVAESDVCADDGPPSFLGEGPDVAGLEVLSVAASLQTPLRLPDPGHPPAVAGRIDEGRPSGPAVHRGLSEPTGWSAVSTLRVAREGRTILQAVQGCPVLSVPPVLAAAEATHVSLLAATVSVAPCPS